MRCIIKEQQQEEIFMSNQINGSVRLNKTYRLTMLGMFTAILLLLTFIPNLGYITIIPSLSPTTLHIPVIIFAILMGPEDGAIMGFIFGITSIIAGTFIQPNFLFSPFVPLGSYKSVILAIVPRILVGILAAYTYKLVERFDKTKIFACSAAAIVGSLTNTVLVLAGIFLLFKDDVARMYKISAENSLVLKVLWGIVATNGVAEVIVAIILVTPIARALLIVMKKIKTA
jgi:uncharacterized membrane protein